ncbi:MAG: preprotein translocase subunit YajC [Lachnospiraceae bacterium]|nr:preprotein translocase subunit YajC [Falcatimonas sp. MSJ-15]MBQ5735082.1 preprotein translocase subunit YajC [Lachnospiraceae bacterium]MBU5471299.1 preprotein translocase subunit YajC [Falcatimonas sp. MSJ-15]MEE0960628.1 preprotein translocase subunit YajC [Lachnospiraceae bacterium]
MNFLLTTAASASGGTMGWGFIIGYIVLIGALMYFMAIRPQKKQQKKQQELMNSVETGDSILTTSGFYGVVIDITDDTVIVEFGNNKNCRIPMQKSAIVDVEKAKSDN